MTVLFRRPALVLGIVASLSCSSNGPSAGDDASSGDAGSDDGGGSADDGTSGGSDGGSGSDDGGGDGGTNTGIPGECGNAMIDGDEACDDGNQQTELPEYDESACIDNCSLVLALCGNGEMDPGEQCDDGNTDSMDECTTSCTINDRGLHAPCTRSTGAGDVDVTSGEITGCENVEVPEGMALSCVLSNDFFGQTLVYAAEGDCQTIALKCTGPDVACPPDAGDYDADITCPAGTVLAQKNFVGPFDVMVDSKVCQKACETDAECRWNAHDEYWDGPGEYRCEVTDFSGGERVCNDARNNE